jgi:hypothetical protein
VLIAGKDDYGLNRVVRENAWGEPFSTVDGGIGEK